jgi:ABC-2 type transport system permease protein
MMPLTFLGGVFYSVRHLPEPFRTISLFNPVVHMVEGLRAGMLGLEEGSTPGLVLLVGLAVTSTAIAWRMLDVGYKLKT